MSEAVIFALELGANDITAESTGTSSTSSTTWQTKVTLSFTPPSAGDYLIVGHRIVSASEADANNAKTRLYNGAVAYSARALNWWNPADHNCALSPVYAANLSGAQSWQIQYAKNSGTGSVSIKGARTLALRLADFDGFPRGGTFLERLGETE
jgi:hypothetical protein